MFRLKLINAKENIRMKTMLKRLVFIICIILLSLPHHPAAEIIDRVVAVVNDDIITLSELNKEGENILKRVTEQTAPNKVNAVLQNARHEILSKMIDRKIIVQKAEEMNIKVSDEEVSRAIQTILDRNNSSEEQFKRELAIMGISEDSYRASIREQLLQTRLISYEVTSKIVITEEKADEYYNKNFVKDIDEGDYYILHMGIVWGSQGKKTKEEAMAMSMSIREKVLEGESFKILAMDYSDLPSASYGGDVGVIKKDEMASYMRESVTALLPGQVSPIVESGSTYHLFQLLAKKEDGNLALAPFTSVRNDIIDLLRNEEQEKHYKKWVTDLREKTYIKKLL